MHGRSATGTMRRPRRGERHETGSTDISRVERGSSGDPRGARSRNGRYGGRATDARSDPGLPRAASRGLGHPGHDAQRDRARGLRGGPHRWPCGPRKPDGSDPRSPLPDRIDLEDGRGTHALVADRRGQARSRRPARRSHAGDSRRRRRDNHGSPPPEPHGRLARAMRHPSSTADSGPASRPARSSSTATSAIASPGASLRGSTARASGRQPSAAC